MSRIRILRTILIDVLCRRGHTFREASRAIDILVDDGALSAIEQGDEDQVVDVLERHGYLTIEATAIAKGLTA